MASTTLPPAVRADKALVRRIADVDDSIENVEEFAELIAADGIKSALRRQAAELRRRLAEAVKDKDLGVVGKALVPLGKDAAKLADQASGAHAKDLYERCTTRLHKARGLLAQAMVEVGRIEPLALRLPLQKEQAALRKALDEVESAPAALPGSIVALDKLQPQIESLLKRLEPVRKAGDWMRASYLPQRTGVEAAIKRVTAERCRKSLLAELDFIDADTNKALGEGDAKAVQARGLPRLQRIERLCARIVAASPAVDRELARLAKAVAAGGPAALAQRLKLMIKAKASTWPAGADADDIEAGLAAFEADLARLAGEIDRAAATAKA